MNTQISSSKLAMRVASKPTTVKAVKRNISAKAIDPADT